MNNRYGNHTVAFECDIMILVYSYQQLNFNLINETRKLCRIQRVQFSLIGKC